MFLLFLFSFGSATLTQIEKLGNPDTFWFGYALASSANGSVLAVGSPQSGNGVGAVSIFTKISTSMALFQEIDAENQTDIYQEAGTSVAVSSDGTMIAYGEPFMGTTGDVIVTQLNSSSGQYETFTTLTPSDNIGAAQFGTTLWFCSGNTLVIGGDADNTDIGAIWVFTYSSTLNTFTQVAKLIGSGYSGRPAQGRSLTANNDCSVIVWGGPNNSGSTGAVWVFNSNGINTWTQDSASPLVGTGTSWSPKFGYSVSLSGTRLAVGGPNNNLTGAVWIFDIVSSTWTQTAYLRSTHTTTIGAQQGASVYLSSNAATLYMGAANDGPGRGRIHVFAYVSSSWSWSYMWTVSTTGDTPHATSSMRVSQDESTFFVGAQPEDYGIGAVYVLTP